LRVLYYTFDSCGRVLEWFSILLLYDLFTCSYTASKQIVLNTTKRKADKEMHEPLLDSSKTVIHGSHTMNKSREVRGMSGLHKKTESRLRYRQDPASRDDSRKQFGEDLRDSRSPGCRVAVLFSSIALGVLQADNHRRVLAASWGE
jgi:hypothetical protein